ncbi:MAG: hypothetical protein A2128_02690 [Candidatus Liptonbacteria bacterium GWC1_60_9]|uniref:Uncharacterized protein n=1 Tax=Candidatus Liptonbacteria bacterium GWC1_60_9 TaxID=1798645 RepID=A0A1G2C4W1_9BACT|nr:MAG: hypothetical protein A2128_02690 [Candidatus Liptonbacteria bacterium GWC1_60_9]
MFLGTQSDNLRDAMAKGRMRSLLTTERVQGERNVKAKLTAADIIEIRRSPISQEKTARLYGVTQPLIGMIRRRLIWKHVP